MTEFNIGNEMPTQLMPFVTEESLLVAAGRKLVALDLRGVDDMNEFYMEPKKCVALKLDTKDKRIFIGDAEGTKIHIYLYK